MVGAKHRRRTDKTRGKSHDYNNYDDYGYHENYHRRGEKGQRMENNTGASRGEDEPPPGCGYDGTYDGARDECGELAPAPAPNGKGGS